MYTTAVNVESHRVSSYFQDLGERPGGKILTAGDQGRAGRGDFLYPHGFGGRVPSVLAVCAGLRRVAGDFLVLFPPKIVPQVLGTGAPINDVPFGLCFLAANLQVCPSP